MKKLVILAGIVFLALTVLHAQENLSFQKSYQVTEKQKKLQKLAMIWAQQQPSLINVTTNETDIVEADGFFGYANPVQYAGSATISRAYADQINGKLAFHIKIVLKDNEMDVIISDYDHKPNNQVDKIYFGKLTSSSSAPDYLYMDYDKEYCDKVWANMKEQAKEKSELIFAGLPEQLMTEK